MPCDGKITKVNEQLEDEPQHISIAAEEDGWLMEFEIEDVDQLDKMLDEKSYKEFCASLADD